MIIYCHAFIVIARGQEQQLLFCDQMVFAIMLRSSPATIVTLLGGIIPVNN